MVLDELCNQFHLKSQRDIGPSQIATFTYSDMPVMLLRPISYMNLSGRAIKKALSVREIYDFSRVMIVLDDINLPFGYLRLRPGGSAGGQKGLKSILDVLETTEIPRLRIGIGNSFKDAAKYVLSPFNRKEREDLPFILNAATSAIKLFLDEGIRAAMDKFNKNVLE
jgi:PTH1 family peptidyl-tRNA hydrolase